MKYVPDSIRNGRYTSTMARSKNVERRTFLLIVMIAVGYAPCYTSTATAEQSASKKTAVENVVSAIFSPDGQYILAAIRDGRKQHLHLFSIDGSQHRQLTTGKRFDFDPSLSPDGKEIVFCSSSDVSRDPGKHSDIYTIATDGGETTQLTSTEFSEYRPLYFPSGTDVLFEGSSELFRADIKTGRVDKLTTTRERETYPVINPSDGSVIFWRARWYGSHSPIASDYWQYYRPYLLTTSITSIGVEKSIGSGEFGLIEAVVDSPKTNLLLLDTALGAWLMWTITQPDSPRKLAPFDPEYTGDPRNISSEPNTSREEQGIRPVYYPSFMPEGNRVLFVSPDSRYSDTDSDYMDIYTVDIRSFETRRITRLAVNIREPQISPSGDQVLFLVDPKPLRYKFLCQLWIMNLDGSNPRQFVTSE